MNTSADDEKASNTSDPPGTRRGTRSLTLSENRVDSGDLFANVREIAITHGNETYRLRLTAQNKLILTK
jgi:hemin uptake protein HemP